MAKMIKEVLRPHPCREEIAKDLGAFDLRPGSIAECSCGKQFVLRDDQRDGLYWADIPRSDVMTAEELITDGASVADLHANSWVSLRIVRHPDVGVNGYVYSHESRCQGRIVAVLPFRDSERGREFLVKSEMTPCWGFDQVLSAITGGYEGGDIEDDAVREMLEETGYEITRDELIPLGTSYASKSADTVYSLFSVDLTGREAGEMLGDGSRLEAESLAVWLDLDELAQVMDPQVAVMWMRLAATGTKGQPE